MHLYPEQLSEKIGFETVRAAVAKNAHSVMAREQLSKTMLFSDRRIIKRRLGQTGEMMDLLQNDTAFPLNSLHDIRAHLKQSRAENRILPLSVFLEILEVCITVRRIKSYLDNREKDYPQLKTIAVGLIPLKPLEETLQGVLTKNGELRSDASPRLQSIRKRMNNKRNELRNTINRVMARISKQGRASDEGPTIRSGRMVIPVLAEYKRKVKGFIHDVSSTGQTVYLEPVEALNINNEIRQLESEEQREIERILRELTAEVGSNRKAIRQNLDLLTTIDVISAKAQLIITLRGTEPVISETSDRT